MANAADKIQLRIPAQDLKKLSFTAHAPKKFQAWLDSLPMVNLGEASRQLYLAIQEINRLQIEPLARYQLLELIRPPIHFICDALGKHYLNKSIVLPQKASKVASLAQAMQNHLAIGYKIVVVQGISKIRDSEIQSIVTHSIHRAIADITRTLLRCYQLYFPTPSNLWRELNRLYLLAEHHKLLEKQIEDTENNQRPMSSIREAYIRAILLSTSKPNQLRQQEIAQVNELSLTWAHLGHISSAENDALFVTNLAGDHEPIYASLMKNPELPAQYLRYIDCQPLSSALTEALQNSGQGPAEDLRLPPNMSMELCRHLIHSWGKLTQRAFSRTEHSGCIDISLGMSATHYFLAENCDFDAFLRGSQHTKGLVDDSDNPFLVNRGPFKAGGSKIEKADPDVWNNAFDADEYEGPSMERLQEINLDGTLAAEAGAVAEGGPPKYGHHSCDLVNTSPGGYCVSWKDYVPDLVKTGEILGLREANQASWSVGVIRWVKQFHNEGARMGLELLAPKARAIAIKLVPKTGEESQFMRAFLLPELKAIGQPATLITHNLGFQVGSKVYLKEQGEELKAQLIRKVASTAGFLQFQFKYLDKKPEEVQPAKTRGMDQDDDFESIWSSL